MKKNNNFIYIEYKVYNMNNMCKKVDMKLFLDLFNAPPVFSDSVRVPLYSGIMPSLESGVDEGATLHFPLL